MRSASVSTRFVTKIEARLKKIPYVTKVKVSGEGAPSGTTKSGKDKCTSDRLLDDRGVRVMNVMPTGHGLRWQPHHRLDCSAFCVPSSLDFRRGQDALPRDQLPRC